MRVNIWKYTVDIHRRAGHQTAPGFVDTNNEGNFTPHKEDIQQLPADSSTTSTLSVDENWEENFERTKSVLHTEKPVTQPTTALMLPAPHHSTWQIAKIKLGIISEEAFHVFLVTYLLLLLVETIKPDFVSYFFNLNILLAVVLVFGVIMALCTEEKTEEVKEQVPVHWKYITTVSIAAALLVYYKTEDLRGLSIVLTILTGGIIFLLSYVISVDSRELT